MPPRKRSASTALPTLTVHGRFRRYPHDGSNGPFERNPVAKADTINIDQSGLPEDTTYARRAETLAKLKPVDCVDRAILIQTSEHHDQIRAAFKNDKELRAPLKKKYKGGEFGENIYCSGGDADTLCIGDVLTLVPAARKSGRAAASDSPRGASNKGTLKLQISNPRRPCSKVDLAYGKTFGGDGVRAYCARTGRAGFFVRVLQIGELIDGAELQVVERPYPQWTLSRVSDLLYGMSGACDNPAGYTLPGTPNPMGGCRSGGAGKAAVVAKWKGTEAELRELAGLTALCGYEWRDEFEALLKVWDEPESRCVVM